MAGPTSTKNVSQFDDAALKHRLELQGRSGPQALLKNFRVFLIASFACLGGLLYGYNQGVFSGVLTMYTFNEEMGVWTQDQTKKGTRSRFHEPSTKISRS